MKPLLFFAIALLFVGVLSARAAVFTIPDGDVIALKDAINTANMNGEDDTIELAAGGSYVLATIDNPGTYGANSLPIVGADSGHKLTIHGNGAVIQRSSAGGTPEFRVLHVDSSAYLALSSLTVANGDIASGEGNEGGGVFNNGGTLIVDQCIFNGNSSYYGGAVENDFGTLQVSRTTFNGNSAESTNGGGGGGIDNVGQQTVTKVTQCVFTNNSGTAVSNVGASSTSSMIVSDSTFTNNSSIGGFGAGAILNLAAGVSNAAVTVTNSTFSGNSALAYAGGAIYSYGFVGPSTTSVVVDRCTMTNNSAQYYGGAVAVETGSQQSNTATFSITNSTLQSNSAGGGGGIFARNASNPSTGINLTISNTTLAGNAATNGTGGAIYALTSTFSPTAATISSCTISGNWATGSAGGIYCGGARLLLANTILKTGASGANIHRSSGMFMSQGYNLSDDNGEGLLTGPGDQINTDPMLDAAGLQNNGGPTQTIALLPGSPAIHAGDPNAPARDQRYYLRNGAPDKGAFEYGGTISPLTIVSRKTHGAAGTFDVDLPLNGNTGVECRSGGAGGNHRLVLTFATPVTIGSTSVTTGTGSVSNTSVNDSQVTLDLTGVANAQQIVLTVSGVSDGANTNNVIIPMRVLLADTTGNSAVNASDVSQTKAQVGQAVTNSNFRTDINLSGTITASDVTAVKSKVGTVIPIPVESAGTVGH